MYFWKPWKFYSKWVPLFLSWQTVSSSFCPSWVCERESFSFSVQEKVLLLHKRWFCERHCSLVVSKQLSNFNEIPLFPRLCLHAMLCLCVIIFWFLEQEKASFLTRFVVNVNTPSHYPCFSLPFLSLSLFHLFTITLLSFL